VTTLLHVEDDPQLAEFEIEPFARVAASLFPVVPTAMKTMVNFATKNVADAAAWLEARVSEPAVRERIDQVRADAARLRALYVLTEEA